MTLRKKSTCQHEEVRGILNVPKLPTYYTYYLYYKNRPLFVFSTHFTVPNSEIKEKYTDIYDIVLYIDVCLLNAFIHKMTRQPLSKGKPFIKII